MRVIYLQAFEAAINCPIYANTNHTLMKFLYKLLLVRYDEDDVIQLADIELLTRKYLACLL